MYAAVLFGNALRAYEVSARDQRRLALFVKPMVIVDEKIRYEITPASGYAKMSPTDEVSGVLRSARVSVQSMAGLPEAVFGATSVAHAMRGPRPKDHKLAVGKMVVGSIYYVKGGRFTYAGGNTGKNTISEGKICVTFDSGNSRCDNIVKSGNN